MNATTLAIEIIKMEGVEKSWNTKFYQPGEQVVIYVKNESIDITEKVNQLRDSKGMFQSSPVVDEYTRIRKEAFKAGMDAMMAKQNRNEAYANYINNL